jgi:ubiquinone/menaquinone biosynthesis C-methylase UbiE
MAQKVAGSDPASHFDRLSTKYEEFIGLVTGSIGRITIDYLIPEEFLPGVVHDNACGTGLVTDYLQQLAKPPKLIEATDFVPSVTQILQRKASDKGWNNVHVTVMDSQDLTFPDNHFDLSITNFGIFFLPEPQKGANQIYRTLKPGGMAVVSCWKHRHIMDVIVAAQRSIRPDLEPLASPWTELWSKEETLQNVLLKAGFPSRQIQIVTRMTDAMVEPFFSDPDLVAKSYPAATEGWTAEEKNRLGPEMLRIAKERDPEGGGRGALMFDAYVAVAIKGAAE